MKQSAFSYDEAAALLKQLIAEHGCKKRVDLEVSPALKRTLGQAVYTRRNRRYRIRLSAYLTPEEMDDTLRHEFAHVMAGLNKAHGEVWKHWAWVAGARPERCAPQYPALVPLHTYTCPKCDDRVVRRVNRFPKKSKGLYCVGCRTPVSQFIYAYVDPSCEAPVTPAEDTAALELVDDGEGGPAPSIEVTAEATAPPVDAVAPLPTKRRRLKDRLPSMRLLCQADALP